MITFFKAKKGFTLLAISYKEFASKRLEPLKINLTEANILHTLFNEGDGLTQETFVLHLFMDKASISRNIRSLIKKGFVTRHQHPTDKRAQQIFPTSKAEKLKDQINTIFDDWLNKVAYNIPQEEIKEALVTFEKVINNAKELRGG